MKRLATLLLALCMVLSMTLPVFAQESSAPAEPPITETEIIAPTEDATAPIEETPDVDEAAPVETEPVLAEESAAEEKIALAAKTQTTYLEVTDLAQITADGVYAIADRSGNRATILYNKSGSAKSDQVTGNLTENELALDSKYSENCQTWSITTSGKGYAIQGKDSNSYLHLDKVTTPEGERVPLNAQTQELTITAKDGGFTISREVDGKTLYVSHVAGKHYYVSTEPTTLHIFKQTAVVAGMSELKAAAKKAADKLANAADFTEESQNLLKSALDAAKAQIESTAATEESVRNALNSLTKAMQAMAPVADKIAAGAPANGKTEGQPFPAGIAGSDTFRIPAITTLKNGWLAAAIDARWNKSPDGDNIDTLFSISKDNGKTWEYTFPNFFNDSVNQTENLSTAFIDPVMVQGADGTIYLMVDLFPAGHYIGTVETVTGYENIGGTQRLVLYTTLNGHNSNNYAYYVGNFTTASGESKAFAPVIANGSDANATAAYYVDDHYNLYNADKKPMYCRQLGSDKYVQQNVFFYNADLHVRNATYLWLVTSKDNGKTWSAPSILNPQVRPAKGGTTHRFYGVGPGAGLALKDGTVMLPCYVNRPEKSSFIYTRDNGKTWKRSDDATVGGDWSSESTLVQIDDTTVRQFCRDGHSVLRYTDHVWDEATQTWKRNGNPVAMNDIPKTSANQLSAIRYSKLINGKPVIMVSTATMPNARRTHGKIYTFNLNEDKSMTLIGTCEITKPGVDYVPGVTYGYSSLTEQSDGSIGLLYEDTFTHGTYLNLPLHKLIPGVVVDGQRSFEVPLFGTYEDNFTPVPTAEDLKALDTSIVTAEIKDGKVVFTGVKEGTTSFTSNGVVTKIHVVSTYPTKQVEISCRGEHKITVSANPTIVNNSNFISTSLEPIQITGGQGTTGTNKNYDGKAEALATALYTFRKDGERFQVSAATADGTMTWLDPTAAPGFPFSTQARSVKFVPQAGNSFFILGGEDRYLYFWPNKANQYTYDAVSTTKNFESGCTFKLYRLVKDGENPNTEIPGYVQATNIEDGEQYLIVANVNGSNYVMRPSTSGSSRYAHVLKVNPNAEQITATVANTLTFTANGSGTANILVDGTVYQVTAQHKLTRVDRVEPTATEPGNILYWHCEICGENFLDEQGTQPVQDVVIPATGTTPDTKPEPEKPDTKPEPEKPDTKPEPEKPDTKPEPEKPDTKPENPDNNTSDNTTTPATGDVSHFGLWLTVMVLAVVACVGIVFLRKRENVYKN